MLKVIVTLLASGAVVHAAVILPHEDVQIANRAPPGNKLEYVYVTEYKTVFVKPSLTAPAQTNSVGKSAAIVPTLTEYLQYGPSVKGPAPSTLNWMLDPFFINNPRGSRTLRSKCSSANQFPAPLPTLSQVQTTVNPITSTLSSTALVVVPITTNLPKKALRMLPETAYPVRNMQQAKLQNRGDKEHVPFVFTGKTGKFAAFAGKSGIIGLLPGQAFSDGVVIYTSTPVFPKPSVRKMTRRDAAATPTSIVELSDASIEHGEWFKYSHNTKHVDDGEFKAIIPVHNEHDEESQETDGSAVPVSQPPHTAQDVTKTKTRTTTFTKTLKRSSSTPTPRSTLDPKTQKPTTQQPIDVHTSVLTADPRCPYPFPGIYCGKAKTTLITMTKAPTPSSLSSTELKDKKKTKAWCPYPGQQC